MIERTAAEAVPFARVAGDEVYGGDGPLRARLEARRIAHVLAVACDHRVPAGAGHAIRADQLAARLPGKACQRLSAGAGAKGHSDQIPLTRNEIAHLLSGTTIRPARDDSHRMRWSRWRRRHQHRARTCHYQRQTAEDHGT